MTALKRTKEFKGTRECAVKHFVFCYDNGCQVYKEAKYGASYWPQESSPDKFKGTAEEDQDCLDKLDQDLILTCSQKSAKIVIQR